MKSKIRPLKRSNNLRLLDEQTRINCAVELAERRKENPDLSINQLLNDLINTGLSVTHHECKRGNGTEATQAERVTV